MALTAATSHSSLPQSRPDEFDVRVCVTAQHREMLDQVLSVFEVRPDYDLNVMRANQSLSQVTARMIAALEPVIAAEQPDMVIVQGDTTTTFCGALAAFYQRVSVGHVEAGLRTGDLWQPFPEELNRVLTTRLTKLHCAPTAESARNLRADGVADAGIFVTGNSGIDAVLHVRDRLSSGALAGFDAVPLDPGRKQIVVTAHRRENFGDGLARLYQAIARLAERVTCRWFIRFTPIPTCANRPNNIWAASRTSISLRRRITCPSWT